MIAHRREDAVEHLLHTLDGTLAPDLPRIACSASTASNGVAATPPNANRARRTRPLRSRSSAIAAATVLMSSRRRLATL
jgi:hypothetical protein